MSSGKCLHGWRFALQQPNHDCLLWCTLLSLLLIIVNKYIADSLFPVCGASPSSCKVGPVSHHASAQFLLLQGVVESLLQWQAEHKLDLVAVDHTHPLRPGQVGRSVVEQVEVDPSLWRRDEVIFCLQQWSDITTLCRCWLNLVWWINRCLYMQRKSLNDDLYKSIFLLRG